jgi:hypothetical protein
MRREGGWIPIYRARREADTMVAGHIAKAMRDIDDEAGKNDWVRAIISRGEAVAEARQPLPALFHPPVERAALWPLANCTSIGGFDFPAIRVAVLPRVQTGIERLNSCAIQTKENRAVNSETRPS